MINISRTNNNLVITNDSNYGFPFQDGQLVIPVNSIIYTLETESDYITFRSSANNDVLFSGTLGNITIDGTVATRDNFIDSFNALAYASVGSGSGSGSSVTVDSTLSTTSTNPVQNKVISEKINEVIADVDTLEKTNINGVSLSGQTITLGWQTNVSDYTFTTPSKSGNFIVMRDAMSDINYTHTFGFNKSVTEVKDDYFNGYLNKEVANEMCPSFNGSTLTFNIDSTNYDFTIGINVGLSEYPIGTPYNLSFDLSCSKDMDGNLILASTWNPSDTNAILTDFGHRLPEILVNDTDYFYWNQVRTMNTNSTACTITISTRSFPTMEQLGDSYLNAGQKAWFAYTPNSQMIYFNVKSGSVIEGSREVSVASDTKPELLNDYIRYANSQKAYIVTDKNIGQVTYTKEEIDNKVAENVPAYTASKGINIDENNAISLNISQRTFTGTNNTYLYTYYIDSNGQGVTSQFFRIYGDDTVIIDKKDSMSSSNEAMISINTDVVALKSDIPEIKEWVGTQAEYDALTTYDANTTYYIIEEE